MKVLGKEKSRFVRCCLTAFEILTWLLFVILWATVVSAAAKLLWWVLHL